MGISEAFYDLFQPVGRLYLKLTDFQSEIEALRASREELLRAQVQLKVRAGAQRKAMKASKEIAMAMKVHPGHGGDSEIVRASGFVVESERRSGLTRKGGEKTSTPSIPLAA